MNSIKIRRKKKKAAWIMHKVIYERIIMRIKTQKKYKGGKNRIIQKNKRK